VLKNIDIKKITYLLFAFTVFLVIANLLFDKFSGIQKINIDKNPLSIEEVNDIFRTFLKNMGIGDSLVKKVKISKRMNDSLRFAYEVTLPADLPFPVILLNLKNSFSNNEVSIFSKEVKFNEYFTLEIKSADILKLYCEMKVNKSLYRNNGRITLLISDFENSSQKDKLFLLQYPEKLSFILQPQNESKDLIQTIQKYKKDYTIFIDENSPDIDYKLSAKYSKDRNLISIKNIVGTFYQRFFLVDFTSSIWKNSTGIYLKNEFEKRKLKLIPYLTFNSLESIEEENVNMYFNNLTQDLGDKDIVVKLTTKNLLTIEEEIKKLRLKGIKFVGINSLL